MNPVKRIVCILLSFILLFSLFVLPGGAVEPGNPWNEDLTHLYEMKYGHKLDRVIAGMTTDEIESYPFFNDPQVEHVELLARFIYEPAPDAPTPFGLAPGTPVCSVVITLHTKDEESLNAFIEKYKNAGGVAWIETDGIGYIPETRWTVLVTLDFISENGDLLPDADFTPAFFSEDAVKAVYTVPFGESALYAADLLLQIPEDDSLYSKARQKGVACKAVLELKENDASPAAAFALELIDYEHSALFTEAQKEQFRLRLSDIELVAYDGVTYPLQTLAESRVIKVWTRGGADLTNAFAGYTAICAATDGDNAIWHLKKETGGTDLKALAALLKNTAGVADAKVFDGVSFIAEQAKDFEAGNLMRNSTLVPGDADCDGKLTVADARAALRCAIGLEGLSYEGFYAADTDGDKDITTFDARNLLRAAIGITDAKNLCFTLPMGHALLIGPLTSYHDGGYLWTAKVTVGDEAGLRITERLADILPPYAGSGAYTVFAVSGSTPGRYRVHIECKRPWDDGENRVLEAYDITVNVIG